MLITKKKIKIGMCTHGEPSSEEKEAEEDKRSSRRFAAFKSVGWAWGERSRETP